MASTAPSRPAHRLRADIGGSRIAGVDAARAVALVGMSATHILPLTGPDGAETAVGLLADGRASALFAVLAGVGVALSTGGPRRPADGRAHLTAGAGLLVRAVLVGLLGLALVGLGPPVAVILAYYGLLFVVAIPLLRLPAVVLGVGAVLAGALTPVLSHTLRTELPDGPGPQASLVSLAEPADLFLTLSLTGYYPVLTWTTYLLAGMAVGRMDLRRVRVAVGLLVGGGLLAASAAVVSAVLFAGGGSAALDPVELLDRHHGSTPTDTWWWLVIDTPHSGTPFDLAHTTGTGLAVLGLMLLLDRFARPVVWVPAAVGAIPLTLYTLHVTALAIVPPSEVSGPALWTTHLAVAIALGALLRLAGLRGPLEWVVSTLSRAARAAVPKR